MKSIREQTQKRQWRNEAFKKSTPKLKPLKVDKRNI